MNIFLYHCKDHGIPNSLLVKVTDSRISGQDTKITIFLVSFAIKAVRAKIGLRMNRALIKGKESSIRLGFYPNSGLVACLLYPA